MMVGVVVVQTFFYFSFAAKPFHFLLGCTVPGGFLEVHPQRGVYRLANSWQFAVTDLYKYSKWMLPKMGGPQNHPTLANKLCMYKLYICIYIYTCNQWKNQRFGVPTFQETSK